MVLLVLKEMDNAQSASPQVQSMRPQNALNRPIIADFVIVWIKKSKKEKMNSNNNKQKLCQLLKAHFLI